MKNIFLFFTFFLSINISGQEFKVMTYNVRCGYCDENNENKWDSRKELILSTLTAEDPDLIGFQEIIPDQVAYLSSNLPIYNYFGTGHDADGKGEGCFIFYKKSVFAIDSVNSGTKWYSTTPDVPGSGDMGDIYQRVITFAKLKQLANNKSFCFFNTHVTYIDSLQLKYNAFLASMIIKYKNGEPFILTGDFNADETSPAMGELKQSFSASLFRDTYRDIHPNDTITIFNGFSEIRDGKKIDYIFVEGKYFKTTDAGLVNNGINGKYPSDHFPLVSVVKFIE
jgi:endonuclease/exonuclease/phosphatase family metal-dependent hydrolase